MCALSRIPLLDVDAALEIDALRALDLLPRLSLRATGSGTQGRVKLRCAMFATGWSQQYGPYLLGHSSVDLMPTAKAQSAASSNVLNAGSAIWDPCPESIGGKEARSRALTPPSPRHVSQTPASLPFDAHVIAQLPSNFFGNSTEDGLRASSRFKRLLRH